MRRVVLAAAAFGALAAPLRAGDLGAGVRFSALAMKETLPLLAPGGAAVLLDSGESQPLEAAGSALLLSGEAAPGGAFHPELSQDGGPWRPAADGERSPDGSFWFRFEGGLARGSRLRLRLAADGGSPAPSWLLLRAAESVPADEPVLLAASFGGRRAPPIGGYPPAGGPPRPEVRPRSDWGALPSAQPYELMIPEGISVHHTETPRPSDFQGAAARLRSIQSHHQRGRGWSDIAYHFIIDGSGRVWEGRPGTILGAHVHERNDGNLGIALMGDFQTEGSPTAAQLESLAALASWLSWRYAIPTSRVLAHRDQESTACPGDRLYAQLGWLRAEVASRGTAGLVARGGR